MNLQPIAYIVDDDPAQRHALRLLLESVEIEASEFARAEDLLQSGLLNEARPACLVADVRMPGLSGMALLEELRARGIAIPTIMITGYGDIPMAVRAMKLGAIDFIAKPVNHQVLLEIVQNALRDWTPSAPAAPADESASVWRVRFDELTPREQQVFRYVTAGQTNRMVAETLGISVRTAEFHRARVMKKMQARNLADLTLARLAVLDERETGDA